MKLQLVLTSLVTGYKSWGAVPQLINFGGAEGGGTLVEDLLGDVMVSLKPAGVFSVHFIGEFLCFIL